jgi:hypothetical protein
MVVKKEERGDEEGPYRAASRGFRLSTATKMTNTLARRRVIVRKRMIRVVQQVLHMFFSLVL